jgi:methionyl-tRNA formyltransferase
MRGAFTLVPSVSMKIVFFGTPEFAVATLQALLAQADWQVVGVVTQPDRKRGRGNQLVPSPVKLLATAQQIPVAQPARIKKSPETIEWLRSLNADIFVVVAYGQILSQEILDIPQRGCINVHGSLLPAYRGAAPIQRCLVDSVTETGITTMQMDIGMDTGDMLLETKVPVTPLMNAQELGEILAGAGAELLIKTLREQPAPRPQDHAAATHAPPILKGEWAIDWYQGAVALHNQVRGFYPDAFIRYGEQSIKVLATVPLAAPYWSGEIPAVTGGQPGEIVKILKGKGPVVQTAAGYLLLSQVQPPGKKPQSGADFVNGSRLAIGTMLNSDNS